MTAADPTRARGGSTGAVGAWVGLLLLTGFAASAAWLRLGLPLPGCAFKHWTGLPCLTCGSTRMLTALLQGDLALALALNPLVFVSLTLLALWSAGSTADLFLGSRLALMSRIPRPRFLPLSRPVTLGAAACVLAASWAYLLLRGL